MQSYLLKKKLFVIGIRTQVQWTKLKRHLKANQLRMIIEGHSRFRLLLSDDGCPGCSVEGNGFLSDEASVRVERILSENHLCKKGSKKCFAKFFTGGVSELQINARHSSLQLGQHRKYLLCDLFSAQCSKSFFRNKYLKCLS